MKYRVKGFSLIEVLVTLLLTTVGILGMVALQSNGVRYTQDAINRNNAIAFTNDLIEIMRQYPDEFWEHTAETDYNQLKNATVLYKANGEVNVAASACPITGVPQTVSAQVACWLQRVENALPGASVSAKSKIRVCPSMSLNNNGEIACAGSNFRGSSMGVQLAWEVRPGECMDDSDDNATNTICTYQTRFEL